jgi:glycosyltransferase involved in cell wall biosynthesis
MKSLISVVIPTYNRRRYVREALESAWAQTYRPLEIIIIDDGSTDGTEEELSSFGSAIRYLRQQNQGPSAARNRGIQAATGEYIALLDSDDLWAPTKIEKQVRLIERSSKVGVVFCDTQQLNVITGDVAVRRCSPGLRGDIRRQLLHRNCVNGSDSAVLVRRACFDRVGLFDEALKQAEDWDLWIRISRHYHFDYVPEPLVTIRTHGNNLHQQVHVMHEHQMEVIRRAFTHDAIDGANHLLQRRVLAYIHADAGGEYLTAGRTRLALRHLLQTLVFWPFDYRYYILLARALMKPGRVRQRVTG